MTLGIPVLLLVGLAGPAFAQPASSSAAQAAAPKSVPIPAPLHADATSPLASSPSGQPFSTTNDLSKKKGYDPATSRVIARDAKTNTFANADGTRTLESSTGTINFKDVDGTWKPVDNSLVADPDRDGGVTNAANGWRVHFGTSAQGVSLDTASGSIGIIPKDAADVVPEVSGSTVTYADVWPGVDLKYVVSSDAVKETIVIKSADAGSSFGFVTTTGSKQDVLAGTAKAPASMAVGQDGSLTPAGPLGDAVHLDAPVVVSTDGNPSADPKIESKMTFASGVVSVSVSSAWLAAQPASAFPILLDPTLTTGASSWYGFRSDGVSQTNPAAGVQVGNSRSAGDTYWRGIASFPISSVGGAQVFDAEVGLTNIAGTTNAYPMNVYWPSAISYAGVPGTSGIGASGSPGSGAWLTGSVMTSWVQTLANTSYPNSVLGFIGYDVAGSYTYQGYSAQLYVSYDHAPTAAIQAGSVPGNQAVVATTTPVLSMLTASSDPDGDPVTYNFTVSGSGDTNGRASSGPIGTPFWTVPAGVLQDGQTYTWSVATSDGTLTTAATWSQTFTVNQRLGTSQVTPSDSLAGVSVNLANGNANVQVAGRSMKTVGGDLGVNFTYNSQANTNYGLLGQYYADKDQAWNFASAGSPQLVRVDPNLNLGWGGAGQPVSPPGMSPTQYIVKWNGYITFPPDPTSARDYQLGVVADDGAKIYVNGDSSTGTIIYNVWPGITTTPLWSAHTFHVAAGATPTPIQVEIDYMQYTGPADFQLHVQGVSGTTLPDQIVPITWLTPGISTLPAGWTMSPPGSNLGYTKAVVNQPTSTDNGSIVLTDFSGGVHTYVGKGDGGYIPPSGEDAVASLTLPPPTMADPNPTTKVVTLSDADGTIYTFDTQGNPATVTSATDNTLQPASAVYGYNTTVNPPRVTTVTDPVTGRVINLYYGGDSHCIPPSGYVSAPSTMLCQVAYWDGATTDLLYTQSGNVPFLSATVERGPGNSGFTDPLNEWTQFGYTNNLLTSLKSPLAQDWQNAGAGRGSAPVTTDIAYTWVNPASGTAVNNVRAGWSPASGPPYPAGSMPFVTSVTAPSPDGGTSTPRPQHNYSYVGNNETKVDVIGTTSNPDIDVTYDTSGRTLTNTTATGQTTTSAWDGGGQDLPISTTDAAGRKTTTIYDWALRATDTYGPAPATCFLTTGFPNTGATGCGSIPHTHTGFDTDTAGNRINALQTTEWSNPNEAGAPASRLTALPGSTTLGANSSVQYTGELAPPSPGTAYTFSATVNDVVNDGVRVFIDGVPVLDRWTTLNQAILSDTPDSYWRLGDASGITAATGLTSGGTNGTASNVVFATDAGPGAVDMTKAGKFNGTSSQVSIANTGVPSGAGALSIDAWVKPAAIGAYQMIVTKDTSNGATNNPYELRLDPSGHVQFLQSNGIVYTATSTSTLSAGTWYEVTATKTGSGLVQLYVNGNPDGASVTFPGTMSTNSLTALIGERADQSSFNATFNGDIANVSISSKTLTADRVAARYAANAAALSSFPGMSITFDPQPTIAAGSLPAAPQSTPKTIRIDYRNPTTPLTSGFSVSYVHGGTTTSTGPYLDPRYGLASRTTTDDSGGIAGGAETTATLYGGTGSSQTSLDPTYGLATDSIIDPGTGTNPVTHLPYLNLDTKTNYEAPGSGGYLRETASALPSASVTTAAQSTTTAYYASGDTVPSNTCGATAIADQVGFAKTTTAPTPASGGAVQTAYVYDSAGRVIGSQIVGDGSGNWTCTTYDARGRVHTVTYPPVNGASSSRTITNDYAVGGDPLTSSVTDGTITITTVTDLLGRTVSYTDAKGVVTTTTYDQAGRDVSDATTAPGGGTSTVTTSYLDDGRVSQVKLDGNVVATPSYDSAGELSQVGSTPAVSYPTGSGNAGNGGALSTIIRDPQGHETAIGWSLPSSHSLSDTVTLSQADRVMTEVGTVDATTVSAWSYGYDAAGRLTTANLAASGSRPSVAYTYGYASAGGCGVDAAAGADSARVSQIVTIGGTPTTTTSCTDYASRLTSATGGNPLTSVTYNGHGDATAIGNQTVTYSGDDRVTAVASTGSGVTQNVAYVLDANDRLITRTATGTGTGAENSTTVYGYTGTGDTADLQLTSGNALGERYLSLPGGVLLTKRYANPGGDIWSIPNIHGDITATTDGSGAITGSGDLYDPYGGPIDPAAGASNPTATPTTRTNGLTDAWEGSHQRGYENTGGLNDTLMGARLYLPAWGQFTSTDPVAGGNANPYTYPTDPINETDLNGMWCRTIKAMHAAISCTKGQPLGAGDLPIGDRCKGENCFEPPKNWNGKPLKNGQGFRDKRGRQWKSDPSQHGGPHWDVTDPKGNHINVTPEGNISHSTSGGGGLFGGLLGGLGAGGLLWWGGKVLSPACGPAWPACFALG